MNCDCLLAAGLKIAAWMAFGTLFQLGDLQKDPTVNDHDLVREVQITLSSGDWTAFKKNLQTLPPETAFVLLRELGEQLPLDADIEKIIDSMADVEGQIVAGASYMVRATRIRGMDMADRVQEENWQPYFSCRDRSEQLLRNALRHDRKNGLAAAWFMAAAVDGDDEVKDEAAEFLQNAANVPISGYSKLLSANAQKWGGSHDAMWQVARDCAELKWPWSGALIAKAHYEHYLYLAVFEEGPLAEFEAGAYFNKREVIAELQSISIAINDAQSDDPYEAVFAHDVMAAVLYMADNRFAAAKHLRQVGRFGDPALLARGPWWQHPLVWFLSKLPVG